MSTSNPSYGKKVTSEPAPPVKEGAGAVASDSLAAESTRSGGGFSNTSGAHRLDPAVNNGARMDKEDAAKEKKLGGSSTSYPEGSGGQSKATSVTDTTGSSVTGGSTSNAGVAPTYVNSQGKDQSGPHGKNITEGFEGGKTVTGDIGSENDPGRLAEEQFAKTNANIGLEAVPKQKGGTGKNDFDALGGDTSA
ncbi:hypothetical protein M7I_0350 [Glarea lozoyensis 74030]|uniref:Uncharacterized protein n=1 Tax=Glarea lozoyensis (strain ATCC 74030 / MF5533) TaxID=1104152 RepID=H0ED50_GLAL7|nr:hypothetical protein M7I_0350 [Glarea lozoyensis 74030]